MDDRDDLSPADDEGAGPGELPAQTLARVLLVVGGRPGVGGERNERLLASVMRLAWAVRPAERVWPGPAAPGRWPSSVVMAGGAVASKEISPSSLIGSDLMSRSVLSEDTPALCLRSVTVGSCHHVAVESLG